MRYSTRLARSFALFIFLSTPPMVRAVEPESASHFAESVRPVLMQYCGDCHGGGSDSDVKFMAARTVDDLQKARSLWSSVAVQLRNRTMPPADEPQPDEADRLRLAEWIETNLRQTACNGGDFAGAITTRRLNRSEYENTVRDLFGIELGFDKTLPADSGGGEGFDNNGETLFLPPLLLERYLEAAQQIVDAVIIAPPKEFFFRPPDFLPAKEIPEDQKFREVPAGEEISALVPIAIASQVRVPVGAIPGSERLDVTVKVDGIAADTLTFRAYGVADEANQEDAMLTLTRGLHLISLQAPPDRPVKIVRMKIHPEPVDETPLRVAIHRRLIGSRPGEVPVEGRSAARRLLSRFTSRAFRRPVTKSEIDRFMVLYDRAANRDDAYEDRIKLAIKGVLVSPEFLFRIEEPAETEELTPLTDYELATRLSYFLWSTMPDDELRLLAKNKLLSNEETLLTQLERMLDDERANEFFETFIGQWLNTRDVGGKVAPTDNSIQHFYTPDVATDMRREAVLLFQSIVRDNRSLLELIDNDYKFVTGRLAKFYELNGANELASAEFQRYQLADRRRGGVLGLGAVLALTSHTESKETSPVLRGAWVLDTLLGTPVPSPPPNIPDLPSKKTRSKQKLTLRQTLASHRADKTCAACHDLIDPIGFALENFDFLGRWRENADGEDIDTTGSLPSGESFSGPVELKQVLLDRKRDFLRQIVRKVLGYALGRSLVDQDQCTIERLVDTLEAKDYSARSLIRGVVMSPQFRFKQADTGEESSASRSSQE